MVAKETIRKGTGRRKKSFGWRGSIYKEMGIEGGKRAGDDTPRWWIALFAVIPRSLC
jgi:hypothetical protein